MQHRRNSYLTKYLCQRCRLVFIEGNAPNPNSHCRRCRTKLIIFYTDGYILHACKHQIYFHVISHNCYLAFYNVGSLQIPQRFSPPLRENGKLSKQSLNFRAILNLDGADKWKYLFVFASGLNKVIDQSF